MNPLHFQRVCRRSAACALAVLSCLLLACQDEPPPPDIVLVTIDTLRRDHVGLHGAAPSRTPALDRLARGGLVHENAFTTSPITGPAHLSLFTGLYPADHQSLQNGEPLPREHAARDLSARLAGRGYQNAAFVSADPARREAIGLEGFEVWDAPSGDMRPGHETARAALRWLDGEPQGPFFVWLHLYDPHSPYGRTARKRRENFLTRPGVYGWVREELYESVEVREAMAERYAEGVAQADEALAEFLAGLRTRFDPLPLLVVTADHGESLSEHLDSRGWAFGHGFLDPEVLRIPLVISGPGIAPGRSQTVVSLRDVYGTLLAAAGIPDLEAQSEGRRDLRIASNADRIVGAESEQGGAAAGIGGLVVVDPQGAVSAGDAQASAELLELARERSAAVTKSAQAASRVEPSLEESLRRLGYVE